MRIVNKKRLKERLIYILDNYVEAYKLLNRKLELDFEYDSDVVEWSEEEQRNGDAYADIFMLDMLSHDPSFHMHNIELIADILDVELTQTDRHDSEYPYDYSIMYK